MGRNVPRPYKIYAARLVGGPKTRHYEDRLTWP